MIIIMQGSPYIGLNASRNCLDEIQKFHDCQKGIGFLGKLTNGCNFEREILDNCLRREVGNFMNSRLWNAVKTMHLK